jgi:hypothetical protein
MVAVSMWRALPTPYRGSHLGGIGLDMMAAIPAPAALPSLIGGPGREFTADRGLS